MGRDAHPLQNFHLLFTGDGDTVGAALCWKSVMMTGSDVQGHGAYIQLDNKSQLQLDRKENKNFNGKHKQTEISNKIICKMNADEGIIFICKCTLD